MLVLRGGSIVHNTGCKNSVHSWYAGVQRNATRVHLTGTQYCSGDKIEKNEMGGACSAYGGQERRIQGFDGET